LEQDFLQQVSDAHNRAPGFLLQSAALL